MNTPHSSPTMHTSYAGRTLSRSRRGATLVEVAVVMVLLAASAALTLPTLFGVERSGDDTLAKLHLTTALDYELFTFSRTGSFVEAVAGQPNPLPALNGAAGTGLTLTPGDTPPGDREISVAVSGDGTKVGLATQPGDTCWFAVRNTQAGGNTPATVFAYSVAGGTPCTGDAALTVVDSPTLVASGFGRSANTPAVVP